jgi:hypothetical protein
MLKNGVQYIQLVTSYSEDMVQKSVEVISLMLSLQKPALIRLNHDVSRAP